MESPSSAPRPSVDLVKMVPLLAVLGVFLLIPLKISSFGYFPIDDTLRHVAHAVDGRPWGDIVVLRSDILPNVDNHPGWHAFLAGMHHHLGLSQDALVTLSYFTTFIVFGWCGVFASRSPFAWLGATAVVWMVDPELFDRLLLGRPFALTMAAEVVVLFYLSLNPDEKLWRRGITLSVMLIPGLWAHPSAWYLWFFVPAALIVGARYKDAAVFVVALLATLVGVAAATDSIANTIIHPIAHLYHTLGADPILSTNLVGELQPSGGPVLTFVIVAVILVAYQLRGSATSLRDRLVSPDFVIFVVSWILGLSIMRFWLDWGLPAFVVWLTRQFMEFERPQSIRRQDTVWIALLAAGALYIGISANADGRYTAALKSVVLTKPEAEVRKVLPEDGGTLYSLDMTLFYRLFYRFPHAKVHYMVGYEPGMMPEDDLKTLRYIQTSDGVIDAYRAWFDKMTPKDRVVLYGSREPQWPGMVFERFYSSWVGRKAPPAPVAPAPAASVAKP